MLPPAARRLHARALPPRRCAVVVDPCRLPPAWPSALLRTAPPARSSTPARSR